MRETARWWLYLTLMYGFAFLAVFIRASWRVLHMTEAERQRLQPILKHPLPFLIDRIQAIVLDPWFWLMSFVLWGPWLIVSFAMWAQKRQQLVERARHVRQFEEADSNE